MDRELNEQVMIERVEMIARLTTEGVCQERDREIALNLIKKGLSIELIGEVTGLSLQEIKKIQNDLEQENT